MISLAARLLAVEDTLPWEAVRQSWGYRQLAWIKKLLQLEENEAFAGGGGRPFDGEVAALELLEDSAKWLRKGVAPKALAPWFSASVARAWDEAIDFSRELSPRTRLGVLGDAVECLAAALRGSAGGGPPKWIARRAAALPPAPPLAVAPVSRQAKRRRKTSASANEQRAAEKEAPPPPPPPPLCSQLITTTAEVAAAFATSFTASRSRRAPQRPLRRRLPRWPTARRRTPPLGTRIEV